MPASSTSLGSLSSPSPTPSPPPPRRKGSAAHKAQAAYTNNKQAIPPHGLGSDSELSELTEEEQDTADKRENAPRVPDGDSTAAGDDESAGGTSVGGDVSTGTSTNPSRRARQKTSSGGGRKGVGRKKRSSLVPAPMWGWAETKSNVHEEEEEEEMSGPPKPMEEEEDEEEGEEGEEDRSIGGGHSAPIWVVRKAKGKRVVSRGEGDDEDDAMEVDPPSNPGKTNGSTVSLKNAAGSGTEDGEEEEEAESEEGESEDEKSVRIRRPKKPRSVSRADSKDQTESEGDEESDREKPKPKVAARPAPRKRGPLGSRPNTLGGRPRAARNFMLPSRSYQWNKRDKPEVPARGPPSPKSRDNGTEDEEESEGGEKEEGDDDAPDPDVEEVDLPEALSTANGFSSTIVGSGSSKTASSPSQPSSRVVDPVSPLVGVIAAAAAASSIMAGSEVVDPPSSGTSTSSRSASPELTTSNGVTNPTKKIAANAEDDEDCGDTPTPTQPEKKEKPTKHVPPALNIGINGTAVEGGKDDEPSADADVDEPENEQEQEAENDNEVDIDAEIEEPSPEDDLEVELESDLQPAHRAEALDVLAAIELKFALLRERVYVEKMEGLAWEEKLVNEGTHPELIHIQKELLKRRDKRLELASRKREYELKSIAKKRRIHEDSTWSWWKLARDELQTDMIAEASRKRRKLERERRTAERPQPIRRLPMPPSEVPPAPSLRRIIKSFPFADKRKPRNSRSTPKQGAYPELAGLSTQEINADLEIFLSNRRGYDFRNNPVIGFPAPIAPPLGFGGYETYTDHLGNPIVPPGRIPQQHVPSFHQVPQGYAYPNPGTGRMPPPPPAHGHPPPHGHPPGPGMYPMDEAMGHMPQVVPHHYYPPQVNGGGYPPEGVPPHGVMMAGSVGHHGRRSPSPTIIGMNGKQPHGGWIGPGIAPGAMPVPPGYPGPGQGRPKGEWMAGDERRGVYPMGLEDEDRERERMMMMKERDQMEREKREMDREREKDRREGDREREMMPTEVDRERERHMHMMGQHRQGPPLPGLPPPMHQHVHGMPPGQHHHIVGGHHHPRAPHHHHVVHHHHSQPPAPMGPNAPHPGSAMHSPRAPREYGDLRPGSGHGPYPTEVINVALNAKHRDEYPSSREQVEFRERERVRTSRRSSPAPGPSSQSQGSIMGPLPPPSHESGGLTPMPFVLAPTQATSVNGTSSPRVPPGYDAHIRSPGHRFSGAGRSAPPTGPPTPSAGPPPSMSSGVSRESLTMSPARRPPPPQSPSLLNERIDRERERERDRDRDRDRERLGGGSGPVPNDTRGSPNLPRQRSPGPPVKYGPPPPPPPSASGISERGRTTPAMMMRPTSAGGATSPSIGYNKMRPISPPIGSKSLGSLQPLMSPMMGLAGPGRSATPAGSSEGRGRASSFASPSAARNNTNGIVVVDGGEEREREREKDRSGGVVGEETKMMMAVVPSSPVRTTPSARATSPPVTLPPPSKMSLPQMVDGH